MQENNPTGKGQNNETITSSANEAARLAKKIGALTPLQSDWYYLLCKRYGIRAFDIIDNWKAKRGGIDVVLFSSISEEINDPKNSDRPFNEAFTKSFDTTQTYMKHDIVTMHQAVREQLELPALTQDIASTAMADFKNLFLHQVEVEQDENGDGTYHKYKNLVPLFVVDKII